MFHLKCGNRIKLSNENRTATRNASEFNFGLVFSSEPLVGGEIFQFRIDKKIYSWTGGLEVGITTNDPDNINVPPSAVDLKTETWLLAGKTVIKDGKTIVENYPLNLDKLNEGDKFGILRTIEGELEFFMNGKSYGIAAANVPSRVFAVIDVYGKVAQVTTLLPSSGDSEGLCDVSIESGCDSSLELPLDIYVPSCAPPPERLKFHDKTGALVKLSSSGRSAERLRPMDEFNNAVVMTHRPLMPDTLFEIRIDRLVDKWSGSIEVGVTCHDPTALEFPATMTNMRSGTVMMSGCGILTNGKGTKRQYGQYNLDQLRVGDRIGMMRKSNGDLHYYINGMDQGIAASGVPLVIWAVVDLYGMTVKVTIVDRDEREEQNLITRRNALLRDNAALISDAGEDEVEDQLRFHPNCGSHAAVINNGLTALRPNAMDDFNNAVVLSNRPLRLNEVFEVRLDKTVSKWTGSIEIGVTTHGPTELEHPSTMTNVRSGTWVMTGSAVMHNGQSVIDDYGVNLDRLSAGDRIGVVIRDGGCLHFLVNGIDQGEAGIGLPSGLYAVVDLYGQTSQASIVPQCSSCTPTTPHPPPLNQPTDIHFHSLHGRNARVSNGGLTASRPRAMAEFNDAIVITNRPLAPGEMFSVMVERIVDRWTGSIEAGVTAISPSELELPGTMTDLDHDTWMLSGFAVMKDGVTLTQGYRLDLDTVNQGSVIGIKRHDDATLHYYLDGVDMGEACTDIPERVYPCIDLYGRCAQVSIVGGDGVMPGPSIECHPDDGIVSSPQESLVTAAGPTQPNLHSQSETTVTVSVPNSNPHHYLHKLLCWPRGSTEEVTELRSGCFGITTSPLAQGQAVEFLLTGPYLSHQASCLQVGVTAVSSLQEPLPISLAAVPALTYYVQGRDVFKTSGELHKPGFCNSLDWLRPGNHIALKRTQDSTVRLYLNSVDQGVIAHGLPKRVYGIVHVSGSTHGIRVVSKAWQGEAPLASLDAESPSDKRVECDDYNEKCVEDMEKSIEDGELLSEVHEPLDEEDPGGGSSALPSTSSVLNTVQTPSSVSLTTCAIASIPTTSHAIESDMMLGSAQNISSMPTTSQGCSGVVNQGISGVQNGLHEMHGRNIHLSAGRLTAKRVSSYNQGIVLAAQPLSKSQPLFQVRIESMNCRWVSSLSIGVTSQCSLSSTSLPVSSFGLKRDSWVVAKDALYRNSHMIRRIGIDLDTLTVGSTIGLCLDDESNLLLIVNGNEISSPLATLPQGKSYLPLVDLYGMCDQVSVIGPSKQSEWTWSGSRMTSSWGDPISTSSPLANSGSAQCGPNRSKADKMNENIQCCIASLMQKWSSVGELSTGSGATSKPPCSILPVAPLCLPLSKINKCQILTVANSLKESLLLPRCYMSNEVECLCPKCTPSCDKIMSEYGWSGYTRHALRHTASQTKWHKAYSCAVPLSSVRIVLDARRLLTPSELQTSKGYGRRLETKDDSSSNHLTLSPSLTQALVRHTQTFASSRKYRYENREFDVFALFEISLRPGCYKVKDQQQRSQSNATVSSSPEPIEWITKEKDSTILTALLLHISYTDPT